jgi:hypothetical protein
VNKVRQTEKLYTSDLRKEQMAAHSSAEAEKSRYTIHMRLDQLATSHLTAKKEELRGGRPVEKGVLRAQQHSKSPRGAGSAAASSVPASSLSTPTNLCRLNASQLSVCIYRIIFIFHTSASALKCA